MISRQEIIKRKNDRCRFMIDCYKLRPTMRFQNWEVGQYHNLFKHIPAFAWNKNEEFLRYSIENQDLTEMRLDLDMKNDEGEKSIIKNVEVSKKVLKLLRDNGIDADLYYSGGNGMHIHCLILLSNIKGLLYNIDNLNISNYERSFRAKATNNETIRTINLMSKERKKLKELICEYLNITNLIDKNLLSSIVMLTCEGYRKRSSKTGDRKIYIHDEVNKSVDEIMQYIKENKKQIVINNSFFGTFNKLSGDLLDFVNKGLEEYKVNNQPKPKPKSDDFISSDTYTSPKIKINGRSYCATPETCKKHLFVFSIMYNKTDCNSTNKYYQMVATYICHCEKDYNKALELFKLFMNVTPNNLNISVEQKFNIVAERFNQGYTKVFTYNEYLTKKQFYDEYKKIWGGR